MASITGSPTNDHLDGTSEADTLSGLAGDDTLLGAAGDDVLDGGLGRDTATYRSAAGRVDVDLRFAIAVGADGNDTLHGIENVQGSNAGDGLVGDEEANFVSGLGGNDTLYGLGGNDTVSGGAGDDLMFGGDGVDTVSYLSANGRVDVDLRAGIAVGADGNDTLQEIENVQGSEVGDGLVGNDETNFLFGNGGNDTLYGLGANDTLSGGAGDDLMFGGDGVDAVSYRSATGRVDVDLRVGMAVGADGNDTLHEIENVQGSEAGDGLVGNEGANFLFGNGGNDTLFGLGGNDSLSGGTGDDLMYGGEGADTVSYLSAAGRVDVDLRRDLAVGADGNDTLHEIENVQGSETGDGLVGNDGANLLFGNGGNDTLFGLGANDTLSGGAGDDLMYAGEGIDTVSYRSASGRVDVDLQQGIGAGADGNDTLHEFENVQGSETGDGLVGNEVANLLAGNGGGDVLFGLGGNDRLVGGAGGDTLYGGAGVDVFAYLATVDGGDTIGDFTSGSDVLAFEAAAFGGGNPGALQAGRFAGSSAGLGNQSGFVYDAGTGTLSYDADGAGAGAAFHIASLGGGTVLQASDIVLT